MFEPIHGSAFDITGKGIANPIATFWTASMMLEHLGENEAAARLMRAVEKVTGAGILTPDLGGTANTKEVTDAVVRRHPLVERLTDCRAGPPARPHCPKPKARRRRSGGRAQGRSAGPKEEIPCA